MITLFEKGLQHVQSGDLLSALHCYQQILLDDPDQYEAGLNFGVALLNLGRYHDALPYLTTCVSKAPSILTCGNLAICLYKLGHFADAEVMFRRVIAVDPENDVMIYNLAYALLSQGKYHEGWRLFAWRKKAPGWERHQPFQGIPTWHGEILDDHHHLVIYHEQGLGDSLLLSRYFKQVSQRVANVSIVCPTALDRLFRFSFAIPTVSQPSRIPYASYQCSTFDLPEIFDAAIDNIPKQAYLFAPPTLVARWSETIASLPTRPNIGLVWASKQYDTPDALVARRRDISFNQLAPFFAIPNVNFIALQKGDAILESRCSTMPLHDWTNRLDDFGETAALIANLDLVISVDTSVVHLAAALGKPVWSLNRHESCYPWLQDQTIPWYETVREFRQPTWGDWDTVIEQASTALKDCFT
jgi:hypothetical protein